MRPSQFMKRAHEKAEEVAEKTGEVIGKGLKEGWGLTKGLGEGLKKEEGVVHNIGYVGCKREASQPKRQASPRALRTQSIMCSSRHHSLRVRKGTKEIDSQFTSYGLTKTDWNNFVGAHCAFF